MLNIELKEDIFPSQEKVADKYKELRAKYNLSQIMILDNCGVSAKTMWKLAKGMPLAPGTLLRILQGLEKIETKDCLF